MKESSELDGQLFALIGLSFEYPLAGLVAMADPLSKAAGPN
jgi:hypothetical protein